jgi:hypothetical protein
MSLYTDAGSVGGIVGAAAFARQKFVATLHPRKFVTAFQQQGKYWGTHVAVTCNGSASTATTGGGQAISVGITSAGATISAREMYVGGKLGPIRVQRYDGFSAGAVLRLTGAFKVDNIPTASSQEITRGMNSASFLQSLDLNSVPLMNALWNNSNSLLKRNYTTTEYRAAVQKLNTVSSADQLLQILGEDGANVEAIAPAVLSAAGLFGNIGHALGSAFGPVGGAIGHVAGSLADSQFGSAGVFGSAGSFGIPSASGRFGRTQRSNDF